MSLPEHLVSQELSEQVLAVLAVFMIVLLLLAFKYSLKYIQASEGNRLQGFSGLSQQIWGNEQALQGQSSSRFQELYKHFVVSYSWFEPCSKSSNPINKLFLLSMISASILTVLLLSLKSPHTTQSNPSPIDAVLRMAIILFLLDCCPLLDCAIKLSIHLKRSTGFKLNQNKTTSFSTQTIIEPIQGVEDNLHSKPSTHHSKQEVWHKSYVMYTVFTVCAAVFMCLVSLAILLLPYQDIERIEWLSSPSVSVLVILPICWLIHPISLLGTGYLAVFLTLKILLHKFDEENVNKIIDFMLKFDHAGQSNEEEASKGDNKITVSMEALCQLEQQSVVMKIDKNKPEKQQIQTHKANNDLFFCLQECKDQSHLGKTNNQQIDSSPQPKKSWNKNDLCFKKMRQLNLSETPQPKAQNPLQILELSSNILFADKQTQLHSKCENPVTKIIHSKKSLQNKYFKTVNRYKCVFTPKTPQNIDRDECENQKSRQSHKSVTQQISKKLPTLKIRDLNSHNHAFQANQILQLSHQPPEITHTTNKPNKHYKHYVFVDLGAVGDRGHKSCDMPLIKQINDTFSLDPQTENKKQYKDKNSRRLSMRQKHTKYLNSSYLFDED